MKTTLAIFLTASLIVDPTAARAQPVKAGQSKAGQGKAGQSTGQSKAGQGGSPSKPQGKPGKPSSDGNAAEGDAKPAREPPPEPPPPAYDPRLHRLAELLGTLAYMRDLCQAGDGEAWRKQMNALIEVEGDTQARKERLAGAFNRGFRDYQITYRSCTTAARVIISRALEEGERITREVASRYAG